MSRRRTFTLLALTATLAATGAARAAIEATASGGATVQPGGPRAGAPGKTYLNVEGKNNGRDGMYACFGVLDFQVEKPGTPVGRVKEVTLTLAQSVARFSKDGPLKVWVATDTATGLGRDGSPLKFDPKAPGGVGDQLRPLLPLGEARFTKRNTGEADAIALTPTGETETFIRGRVNRGAVVRLVLTPADDDVAATYFGAGVDPADRRPRLRIEVSP